jgi:hypothetical protein
LPLSPSRRVDAGHVRCVVSCPFDAALPYRSRKGRVGTISSRRESAWSRGSRSPSIRASRVTIRDCRRLPQVKFIFLKLSLMVASTLNLSSTLRWTRRGLDTGNLCPLQTPREIEHGNCFAIARTYQQVCLNFRPFPYPLGSAISFLRMVPTISFLGTVSYGTTVAPMGLRSGLPAPLNRLDRNKRPALLPGPAAHSSVMRATGSRWGSGSGELVGKRLLDRPSKSLASNKRQIRLSQHYHCPPDAPRSDPTTRSAGLMTASAYVAQRARHRDRS